MENTESLNIQKANKIDDVIGIIYEMDLSPIGIDVPQQEDLIIMLKMIRDKLWQIN